MSGEVLAEEGGTLGGRRRSIGVEDGSKTQIVFTRTTNLGTLMIIKYTAIYDSFYVIPSGGSRNSIV